MYVVCFPFPNTHTHIYIYKVIFNILTTRQNLLIDSLIFILKNQIVSYNKCNLKKILSLYNKKESFSNMDVGVAVGSVQ